MTSINRAPSAARRRRPRTVEARLRADPDLERRMGEQLAALFARGPLEVVKFIIGTAAGKDDVAGLVADLDAWLEPWAGLH